MRRQVAERVRDFDQGTAAKALFEQARMAAVGDDNQARSSKVHDGLLSHAGMTTESGRSSRAPP